MATVKAINKVRIGNSSFTIIEGQLLFSTYLKPVNQLFMKFPFFVWMMIFLCFCNNPETNKNDSANKIDSSSINRDSNLKGWELYSWYDQQWKFSLLPGTNRLKTVDEVLVNKNIFIGGNELIQNLHKLADGQSIILSSYRHLPDTSSKAVSFGMPPDSILNRIIEVCRVKNHQIIGNEK